ncbi:MAG: hypothetical protein ACI9JT_000390 [Polaribacter sp.]|jgi:hypothetical protein
MKSFRLSSLFLSFFLFFSCSQSLDFDQIEAYTMKPAISASLAFFKIDATNFSAPLGAPIVTEITEIVDFKLFESSFIKEHIVKLDFEFVVSNEFNRALTVEILLLDGNDRLIYKFSDLNISANNLDFMQKEVIDIAANQNVTNFTRVSFTISLDDKSTPLVASDLGEFEFKSATTIYLETAI